MVSIVRFVFSRKLVKSLLVLLAFAMAYFYVAARSTVMEIRSTSSAAGVDIQSLSVGKILVNDLSLNLAALRAFGTTRIRSEYLAPREFDVLVDSMTIRFEQIGPRGLQLKLEFAGVRVTGKRLLLSAEVNEVRLESLVLIEFQSSLYVDGSPSSWLGSFVERLSEIKRWSLDAGSISELKLHGVADIYVLQKQLPVRFHSLQSEDGKVNLIGNVEDLRAIATLVEPKFTEADLEVASRNLLRVPRLMNIRNRAEAAAKRLDRRDPEILYDVPRHVFWSYWLTLAYGERFAREVTVAHETGDLSSSAANTAIDHHHNELGIEYAKKGYPEEEVEALIFTDPRISRIKR